MQGHSVKRRSSSGGGSGLPSGNNNVYESYAQYAASKQHGGGKMQPSSDYIGEATIHHNYHQSRASTHSLL
jgi:hypothetical protein